MANSMDAPWMRGYAQDYDDEKYKEDIQYMKSQYLPMSREIQVYVDDECDMMEYDGSRMFDEYPDKSEIQKIVQRIHNKAKYLENMYQPVMEENENINISEHCTSCRGQESWLENLISVILLNEMNFRRRRYYKRRGRR